MSSTDERIRLSRARLELPGLAGALGLAMLAAASAGAVHVSPRSIASMALGRAGVTHGSRTWWPPRRRSSSTYASLALPWLPSWAPRCLRWNCR